MTASFTAGCAAAIVCGLLAGSGGLPHPFRAAVAVAQDAPSAPIEITPRPADAGLDSTASLGKPSAKPAHKAVSRAQAKKPAPRQAQNRAPAPAADVPLPNDIPMPPAAAGPLAQAPRAPAPNLPAPRVP